MNSTNSNTGSNIEISEISFDNIFGSIFGSIFDNSDNIFKANV